MSKCICINDLKEKISKTVNVPIEDVSFLERNALTGKSHNKFEYIEHKFCPYCGIDLNL